MDTGTSGHFKSRTHIGPFGLSRRIILPAVLLLVGALCIYRSFYGFGWSDETYYSALPYRFLIGDSLFVNSWDIHQTGALITLPLVALYRMFSGGSMEGILLFMRIAYVLCAVLTGLYVYHVASKKGARWAAAISGMLIILFAPNNLGTFSYNTLALLFTALSWFLLADAEKGDRRRLKSFLSGVCFALAVQSYPYLAILLCVYIVYYIVRRKREKNSGSGNAWLFWLLGVAAVCTVFVLVVLVNSSLNNLMQNLKFLLSDPEHPYRALLISLREYAVSVARLFGMTGVCAAAVTAAALAFSFIKDTARTQTIKAALLLTALAVVLWSLVRIWIVSADNSSRINLLALPLAVIGPAIFFINDRKYHPAVWLYIAGWAFSMAVHLGSNNELNHSAYPLVLSAAAVVSYSGTIRLDFKKAGACIKLAAAMGAVVLLATLASAAYVRSVYVYRDEKLPGLTTCMESGPASGIYTTEKAARQYGEVIKAINEYAPETGTALYTKLLPFGYLCTGLRPATPSLWRTRLDSPRLQEYYRLHPELMPDFVFVVDEAYGITNNKNPMQGELAEYICGPDYRRAELDCGTVYIRRQAADNG